MKISMDGWDPDLCFECHHQNKVLLDTSWKILAKVRIGILLPKLFWKTFEIRGWRSRICKIFEIIWTIYSNSERSEQFLDLKKQNNHNSNWKKMLGFRSMQEKLEKKSFLARCGWDNESSRLLWLLRFVFMWNSFLLAKILSETAIAALG